MENSIKAKAVIFFLMFSLILCSLTYSSKAVLVGDFSEPVIPTLFTELSDTPSSYGSSGLYSVIVNAGETALEFFNLFSWITDYAYNRSEVYNKTEIDDFGFLTNYSESDPIYSLEEPNLARIGTCPEGQAVQNTTTGGVECIAIGGGVNINETQFGGSDPLTINESWITGFLNDIYCKLTGCTLTGDLEIYKEEPEIKLNNLAKTRYARIVKENSSNKLIQYNQIERPGGSYSTEFEEGYVAIPQDSSLDLVDTFTISFWLFVNPDAPNGGIINKGDSATIANDNYAIYWTGATNALLFYIGNGSVTQATGTGAGVTEGVWHHLVFRATATHYQVYMDNVQKDNDPITAVGGAVAKDLLFGTLTKAGWWLYGQLDEVAIWDRTLTDAEIAELYNSGAGLFVDPTGNFSSTGAPTVTDLKGLWHFDDGLEAVTVADSSGNGNDGTLNDGVWFSNGVVTSPTELSEVTVWSSEDGTAGVDNGIQTFGDELGKTIVTGNQVVIDSTENILFQFDGVTSAMFQNFGGGKFIIGSYTYMMNNNGIGEQMLGGTGNAGWTGRTIYRDYGANNYWQIGARDPGTDFWMEYYDGSLTPIFKISKTNFELQSTASNALTMKGDISMEDEKIYFDTVNPTQTYGMALEPYSEGGVKFQQKTSETSGKSLLSVQRYTGTEVLGVRSDGTVGINMGLKGAASKPDYPLEVFGNISNISIYAETGVSATDYITRTSVFESDKSASEFVKDTTYYKDLTGEIDHSRFYGYTQMTVKDESKPVVTTKETICKEDIEEFIGSGEFAKNGTEILRKVITTREYPCMEEIITYPYTKVVEGVSLNMEVDVLRQALYEANNKIAVLESQAIDFETRLKKLETTGVKP